MDPMSQVFCLRWNNHRNNLLTVFDHLLETESFCDVTLACEDASVKCHKMILSASSTYFQSLFLDNSCEHPIVFLKDIKYGEIKTILDYMYKGEVNVAQDELPGLLKVAELLKVKGLVEEERERLLNTRDGRGPKGGNDVDQSPSKINGDEHNHNHPRSRGRNTAVIPERDSFRDGERDRHERSDSRTGDNDGRERDAGRESKDGPLTPNGNGPSAAGIRPFMYTPPPGAPHFPMFPGLSNIFPGAHSLFGRRGERGPPSDDRDAGHNGNDREDAAGLSPQHGHAKRKKMESGSGGSSSSKESKEGGDGRVRDGGGSIRCRDDLQDDRDQEQREREEKLFRGLPDADALKETSLLPLPPGVDKSNIANYVPNQRLEWKRYKQYTRNDIMAAIEEVKKGMSALQASRKYNVPSRTLYDKVKKMGITTGRQMQRNKSLSNYPPSFSGMSLLGNDYKNLDDREDSNDNSFVSGEMDGRATMVPPTGLSTLRMLNMLNSERGGKGDGDRFTPMNLSSMLSNVNARSRDVNKITSDSSLSPHSPREHEREEDVGRGDGDIADEDERDGAADSSGGGGVPSRNDKHLSDEVRAQVFADLRRFRGGIPNTNGGDQQATSTTKSPPPLTSAKLSPMSNNAGGSSTATRSISREDNLPPRKRKVSQEHHSVMESTPAPTAAYNGMHDDGDDDDVDLAKQAGESPVSDASAAASPDKPRNDEEPTSRILDCRN